MPQTSPTTSAKPTCRREDATAVLRRLRDAGFEAYFAGGCVRDLLMGLTPQDWDVATNAQPPEILRLFPNSGLVGAAFGVVLVRQGPSTVEVATFRTDSTYTDGRRPDAVRFSTAQEDAQRRDFTINGLFYDPIDQRTIDYVGGEADVRARILRAIGDADLRIAEDHLRMLRAVRFTARFGLNVDAATLAAIRRHRCLLQRISPERIADELRRMLTDATAKPAWRLLWHFGLAEVVFRGLNPPAQLDPARCVLLALDDAPAPFTLCLAAACLSCRLQTLPADADPRPLFTRSSARQIASAMRKALRCSNDEAHALGGSIEGIGPLLADDPPSHAILKRFLQRSASGLSRRLLAAMGRVGC